MLTCITRRPNKQPSNSDHPSPLEAPGRRLKSKPHLAKSVSSQFKGMVSVFKGSHQPEHKQSLSDGSRSWSGMIKSSTTSSGEITDHRSREEKEVVFVEESVPREWVAQVEMGVLITFVSLVAGGNHLKRIRFSKDNFDKTRAQTWWTANFDRVIELYNVQQLDPQAFPTPTPPRSADENLDIVTGQETPATPPLKKEHRVETGYSSSDSSQQHLVQQSPCITDSVSPTKVKTETYASAAKKTSSVSVEVESEWVVEDEPGVYITIKTLPDGTKELKRVRFRRGQFREAYAREWWEENRSRVQKQYL